METFIGGRESILEIYFSACVCKSKSSALSSRCQETMTEIEAPCDVSERLVPGTLAWEFYRVEHQQRYEWASKYCAGKDILDVACGVGYGSEILALEGAANVIGLDVSFEAVAFGGAKQSSPAIFLNADASHLPFDSGTFDVVVSFETIEHLPHPELFLAEVSRVLKSGGLCICSSPNLDFMPSTGHKEDNPFHLSEMSYADFNRLFIKHFEVSERFSQTHSEIYIRHLDLLRELEQRFRAVRFNRLFRMEGKIRGLLGRDALEIPSLPTRLERAVPGDYVIKPLDQPSVDLLTFILVGKAR
jgi:2-polyprenyl-3-methyl-5-hydroxy-6-metoxy-1,4-benzoquinol methylase